MFHSFTICKQHPRIYINVNTLPFGISFSLLKISPYPETVRKTTNMHEMKEVISGLDETSSVTYGNGNEWATKMVNENENCQGRKWKIRIHTSYLYFNKSNVQIRYICSKASVFLSGHGRTYKCHFLKLHCFHQTYINNL